MYVVLAGLVVLVSVNIADAPFVTSHVTHPSPTAPQNKPQVIIMTNIRRQPRVILSIWVITVPPNKTSVIRCLPGTHKYVCYNWIKYAGGAEIWFVGKQHVSYSKQYKLCPPANIQYLSHSSQRRSKKVTRSLWQRVEGHRENIPHAHILSLWLHIWECRAGLLSNMILRLLAIM